MSTSVVAELVAVLGADRSRPRLTTHTPLGRTELSGAALLNWAAKVAGLLVDELGAAPGDEVLVASPSHWQTAGVLLGAWWAGLGVTDVNDGQALAAFVAPGADAQSDEVFVVSGHPLGLPARDLRPHQRDYTTAVLSQPDRFAPRWAPDPRSALRTANCALSVAELRAVVRAPSGVLAHQRVLTGGDWSFDGPVPAVVRLLLRPLGADASVIHGIDLDVHDDAAAWAHRAAVERADVTLGVDVPGLPRLG